MTATSTSPSPRGHIRMVVFYPIELPVAEGIQELLVVYHPSLPFHPSSFLLLFPGSFPHLSPLSSYTSPLSSYLTGTPIPVP